MSRIKAKVFLDESEPTISKRPSLTPEAKENQMIALAMELAEKQLRDGTASSQVVAHFLKLGSSKEKLEQQILEKQTALLEAKTDNLKSAKYTEELYNNALKAMKIYSGSGGENEDERPDEY